MSEDDTDGTPIPHTEPFIINLQFHDTYLVATQPAELTADGTEMVKYQAVSGSHVVEVQVAARDARAVVLRALRATVLARSAPQPVRKSVHIESALRERPFTIDLDREPPLLVAEDVGLPFTVTANSPETFVIRPLSTVDDVRWRLELDWTCAGRPGTTVIPDTDKGFWLYPCR